MSFSSEYAALRKKRKKNEEEETSGTSSKSTNTSSKTSSFAEQYAKLRSERISSAEDKKVDDIAPVRHKGTYVFGDRFLDKYAPTTADRATNSQTVAFRKFDEQNAIMRSRFKTRLDEREANKPENIRKAIEAEARENEERAKQLGMSVSDYLKMKDTVGTMLDEKAQKGAFEQQRAEWEQKSDSQKEFEVMTGRRALQLAQQQEKTEEEAEEEKKRTWFQANAFKDGYDFGDVTKSIGATLGDIGVNVIQGLASMGEGIIDFALYAGASSAGSKMPTFYNSKTGEAFDGAEALREAAQKDVVGEILAPWKDSLDKASFLGDKSDSVSQGLGQVAGIVLTGGAGSAAGLGSAGVSALTTGSMFLSSAGQGIGEAYQSGASEGEAWGYGVLKGIADAGSELIFGGLGKSVNALGVSRGLSSLDDMFAKKLSDGIASQAEKNFVQFGVKSSAEGVEEVLAGLGTAVAQKLTYMSDEELSQLVDDQDLLEQFIVGTVSSAFAQGGGLIQSNNVGRDFTTGYTQNEQAVIDKEMADRIAELEKDGKLSEKEKKAVLEEVQSDLKRGLISTDTIESVLGGESYEAYKNLTDEGNALTERKNAIEKEISDLIKTPESQFTVEQRERLTALREEVKGVEDKIKNFDTSTAKNKLFSDVYNRTSKDTYLRRSYNDLNMQSEDIVIDESIFKGAKFEDAAKKTVENARKAGANNTTRVRDFVEFTAKYSSQSGRVVDFKDDSEIKQILISQLEEQIKQSDPTKVAELQDMLKQVQEGKIHVNGVKTSDGIIINLDSPNYLNTVLGHEATHFLESTKAYKDLQKAIIKFAEMKGDHDGRVTTLKSLYENIDGATVSSELTADLVGDYLFTNYDFVKYLSTENRNIFQKVYDQVKYMFKLATAGSKEARQLTKAMHHFERALRESVETQGEPDVDTEIKYSVRNEAPPKKTIKGYKVFKVVDGKLYPPMVDNPSGNGTPVGVWLNADIGGLAHNKDGSVKLNKNGRFAVESSQGGSLAFRPGWHLGEYPDASQFGRMDTSHPLTEEELATYEGKTYTNQKTGNVYPMNLFPYNFVWAECEVAADHDYQLDAMALGVNEKEKFVRSQAGLPYIPTDGYYKYRTNPDPNTAPWIIAGAIKVNRILDDADVAEICAQHGVTPQTREGYTNLKIKDGGSRSPGNAINLADFNLMRGDVAPTDANTLAEISQADSIANERSASVMELLKTLPGYAKRKINFADENVIKEFEMNNLDVEYYKELAESTKDGYLADDKLYSNEEVKEMKGGSVTKYSLSTWTPETQTRVRDDLVKAGYDKKRVDKWIKDTNGIAAEIASDKDRLDFVAADNQTMLKNNQEYVKTLDASTLCAKRLVYQGTFDAIQHRLPNTVLTSDDLIELRNMMIEDGVEAPCAVCYVESRRRHLGKFAQEWLNGYNGEYKPNLDEVTTSDGLENLRKTHPDAYKDFVSAMDKKGSANPKVVQLRTEYRNEIMSLTPAQIRKIESIGGLRVQSFSDFETPHLLDMMQAVLDMSAKGLTSQAYTKVPNFAWVFGDTGIKINLSLIAEGDGFDADGNLAFSSVEGMDFNEAMKLRDAYSENVGTIIVGANDKHILACMADDRIDYIIPFHRSGWGRNELDMMGMASYKDYTYGQNEHSLETGKGIANLYPPDYWDYNLSGKENAERYLKLCATTGREPKFSSFLVDNGDGSYSLQPDGSTDGYWKMLIDYKMYDNAGNGSAQQKVQPNFNMEQAYRVLKEYEGGANSLPVAKDIVEKFVAKRTDDIAPVGTQFSLSKSVEETKDLFAIHNLNSSELAKTIELGGLPMPSIAVIKAEQGHEKYGDVSLIFPKDTIDPQSDSANKVYGGDAWTPVYPRIEYKANETVKSRVRDKYYELADRIGYDAVRPLYRYANELESALNSEQGEANLLDWLYKDTKLMQVYLEDSGKGKVEDIVKETRTEASESDKQMSQWFVDKLGEDIVRAFKPPVGESPLPYRKNFIEEHKAEIASAWESFCRDSLHITEEQIQNVMRETNNAMYMKFMRDAEQYLNNGGVTIKTETDYKATERAIEEKAADGYKEWVDSLFKGVEEKTGIRNDKDTFTSSGSRRSWDALHWEHNLENVVRAMKAQDQTGADAFAPASAMFAVAHKDYGSIAEIKSDSDRLGKVSETEYKALEDEYGNRLAKIANSIKDTNERNPFIATDEAAQLIVDAVRSYKTKSGMLRFMQKWNSRVTAETVDEILTLKNDIANMPTGYFEAKPQRAVKLEEVGVFVIPRNADVKLKQELLNNGYSIAEYDPNVEGDRQRVVNQFEEYKFSLSNVGEQRQLGGDYRFSGKEFRGEEDIAPVVTDTYVGDETVTDEGVSDVPGQTVDEKISAKVQNLKTELESNKRLRAESNADFDAEIARLQAEYEAKKNKNTKVANDLLRRIERTQRLKANVDADYDRRITTLAERIKKMQTPQYRRGEQRRAKGEQRTSIIRNMIGDTSTWRDKKLGLSYQTNTLHRNLRDIVRDASGNRDIAKADEIYEYLQGSYNENEAQLKRESRTIKQKYADMKINKHESEYIQMLGEFKYNPDTKLTMEEVDGYFNKHEKHIDIDKVNRAISESRKDYDSLIKRVNAVLREQGMKEIPYREGYFPHFTDPKQNWLAKLFNWKTIDTEIPTDIAGLTEEFEPVRTYQSYDKRRKSDETDYNFLKGFDTYVHGALDWIYHIEDIQKRRAFENEIRYSHSEQGIRDKIEDIVNNHDYDADEVQEQIDLVYKTAKNPLNNFVTDLRNSTNNLAGKKSTADREMEYMTNRKIYSTMTNISNRVSGNMVAGSISSALTNFIPITQSWAQVNPVTSLRAMGDMVRNAFRKDGMIEKSAFMTNRLMNEENLYQTGWDKASNVAGGLMNIFDHISTEVIWRSKYLENMNRGMSENEAIHDADIFAENVMAGRSRGNMPTIFNSKNPITKMLTAFQLEVANQYGYTLKDLPQNVGNESKIKLTAGYAKMFIGAYLYNALFSTLTGRDAALDPIGILEDLLKDLGFGDDDDEEEVDVLGAVKGLGKNIIEEVPFVGGLLGGGRVPISSAFWENLTNEWLKPIYYLAMPFGGGQLRKTAQGLGMFSDDHPVAGSYTTSGNLRFPVEDTPLNRVQAALFGQYASKNAREYFDNDYAPLKEKQIQEYIDVDIPIKDYWEYREGLANQKTVEDKFEYIAGLDLPTSKKNILINNAVDRKEDVDLTDYDDFADYEEFDFAVKNPEKWDFMQANGISYNEFTASEDSRDAYNWAYKYPEDYAVSKVVADDVVTYRQYAKTMNTFKGDDKKEQTKDYIFSLDLDRGQKYVLFKSRYKADDTYNEEIIDYINEREDLTYDERITILTELGFTVRNGNIYWD